MNKNEVENSTLKALVEENRKFRKEIMKILYSLIFGLCITALIIVIGNISIAYIYFYHSPNYILESNLINTNSNK